LKPITVDRLFQDSLLAGLDARTDTPPIQVVLGVPANVRRDLSAALLDLLKAELPPDGLELTDESGAIHRTQLDSKLLTLKKDGVTERIVFLRVKDAVTEAVLPTLALSVAAARGGGPQFIVPGAQVLKLLWDKLHVLKRSKDGDAIDAYETLASLTAARRYSTTGAPTGEHVAHHLPNLDRASVLAALERLAELKLIEVATWGQPKSLLTPSNSWQIRL
jgi:hypothetical protein